MKAFKIKEKEFNVCTDWSELTLRQYVSLVKIQEKENEYPIQTLYMLAIFEVLCGCKEGDLDDMDIETLGVMTKDMRFISTLPTFKNIQFLNINGIDYVFCQDLNTLTLSEIIAIQMMQKQYGGTIDFIPHLLSVLLRPGHKCYDNELKKDVWVQDRFDAKNLEHRANLFLECKGVDLMGAANFFLSGKKLSVKPMKHSQSRKRKTLELKLDQKN